MDHHTWTESLIPNTTPNLTLPPIKYFQVKAKLCE